MRDIGCSHATINVAACYNICSKRQEVPRKDSSAETDLSHKRTRGARLDIGPADHGAARPLGAALDLAHAVGTSRANADIARPSRCLRRSLADRASGPAVGSAGGGTCANCSPTTGDSL